MSGSSTPKKLLSADALERARQLREHSSPPERRVWARLRAGRLAGVKFRRQHPIGGFIADFYCHEARLVIEIDGAIHNRHIDRDRRRDGAMNELGVQVLRIPAWRVTRDLDEVIASIAHAVAMRLDTRTPVDRPPVPLRRPATD